MSRYTITESVGNRVESVSTYRDLEKHHPSSGRERGRDYATIDGELEEVRRTPDGCSLIKKDFILAQDGRGPVTIPAPIAGYIHHLNDATNAVRIYDRPFGQEGARLLAQSLHMARGTSPPEGSRIEYGQPMGRMGDTGSPGAIHAHVEAETEVFQRYIRDISSGAISPHYPTEGGRGKATTAPVAVAPLASGLLRQGEQGADVMRLQEQLNTLGFRDSRGGTLATDGDFGLNTRQAVEALQRARGLAVDGVVSKDTFAGLNRTPQPASPAPVQVRGAAEQYRPTTLSNLIGSGEGDYNSFNQGRAGDSPNPSRLNLTAMTLGEITRRQDLPRNDPNRLFAAGKFQIIPGTMGETVRALGLDRNQRFTPDLQERMFADYLIGEKRPAVRAYITGTQRGPQGLGRAQLALAQEFASVADPRTGRSFYDGDSARNSASISAAQAASALNQMRAHYLQNIGRGMSPADAYRGLGGAEPAPTPGRESGMDSRTHEVLQHGASGGAVRALQRQLNRLGSRDAQGQTLVTDGHFGDRSHEAVNSFQRSVGLEADGVVGKYTLAALRKLEQAPLLSEAAHPDHEMYRQAVEGLRRLDPQRSGLCNDQDVANAAASLVLDARVSGLRQIDHVLLSGNGEGLFAVQGSLADPGQQWAHVGRAQAIAQPEVQSTVQLAREVQDRPVLPPCQRQEWRPALMP